MHRIKPMARTKELRGKGGVDGDAGMLLLILLKVLWMPKHPWNRPRPCVHLARLNIRQTHGFIIAVYVILRERREKYRAL